MTAPDRALNRAEKAAVVLSVLGVERAGPILEQFSEGALRSFAIAMSRLGNIPPETVLAVITEFLADLDRHDLTVDGGIEEAREMLRDYVNEATLLRIMDDAVGPSASNVWQRLAKVDETALIDFLSHEHAQTAAVVLSRLSPEHAAQLLSGMEVEFARDVALGLGRAAALDPGVIEAIGLSLGRDFLAKQRGTSPVRPAERIGSIMNFTTETVRRAVLGRFEEIDPDLAAEVKRRLFTFADIPTRLEARDVTAVVRAVDRETLLKALAGAADNAQKSADFLLASISSRVADQIREELADVGRVRTREAEDAQNAILKEIRALEKAGEITLLGEDD